MPRTRTSFKPGSKRPRGAGRKPGQPNHVTVEVREQSRQLVEDKQYRVSLLERLRQGEAGAMEAQLWFFAYGKPKETVAGDNDSPLKIIVEYVAERLNGAE